MDWGRESRPTDWQGQERPASWGEFVQQVIDTNSSGWVFRGQPDYEYELVTFLERSLATSVVPCGATEKTLRSISSAPVLPQR
jgi:hypothetical protein